MSQKVSLLKEWKEKRKKQSDNESLLFVPSFVLAWSTKGSFVYCVLYSFVEGGCRSTTVDLLELW
jgi:hypothetical protein